MLLGACLDAGVPLDACAPRSAAWGSTTTRCRRSGCCAPACPRRGGGSTSGCPAGAVPPQEGAPHAERTSTRIATSPQIERLIARSALAPAARDRAIALFHRLAAVEAEIHQMPIEDVHLHEVGALDSIIDIVGGVFALEWFGADRIVASPLNLGSGTVRCAHGTLPVPAPATARLIAGRAGLPGRAGRRADDADRRAARDRLRRRPSGRCRRCASTRIGYGAGRRDFPDRPERAAPPGRRGGGGRGDRRRASGSR